jgi:ABC-2 type transport system permease protein
MKKGKKSNVMKEEEVVEVKREEEIGGGLAVELGGVYAVWLREVKRYVRDRSRIVTAVISPLVWLILFGLGFAGFFSQSGGVNYIDYLFPGIVAQALMFSGVFIGISALFDRQFGFLKEMLIAPIRRVSVFSGKMLGGATDALIQGTIILILSFLFSVTISPTQFLECLPVMFLITVSFVSLSLVIASRMKTFEGFGLIVNLINLPLFFSSGAMFPVQPLPSWFAVLAYQAWGIILPIPGLSPLVQILYYIHTEKTLTIPGVISASLPGTLLPINGIPQWFQILNKVNPLSYAVDALRGIIVGNTVTSFGFMNTASIAQALIFGNMYNPMWEDLTILGVFALVMVLLGGLSFRTSKK